MGRQGLKGIAPIGDNLYVMNDDGLHVIKLLEIIPDTTLYNLQIIAGQVGIEGKLYHEQGTQALLSRPGRIQSDLNNKRCYFSNRNNQVIRILKLEENFPISTLAVDFSRILPTVDLDFNRIVISESGETLVLVDRKSPYIIMIKNVLEMDPLPLILHTPASGIQSPLQAACFPICPQEFPVWDSSLPQIPGLTQSAVTEINRSLEVCPELCFAAAGSNLWIIPIREDLAIDLPTELPPRDSSPSKDSDDEAAIDSTHSRYHLYLDQLRSSESITRHLVDLSKFRDPFLIHDVISITSSVLLILNRHRDNTGLYQLSTSDWGNTTSSYSLKYLIGKDYVAPHGMTISLDRKQILIVESGSKETSGQSGGYINIMNIHLCESKKSIRISDSRKLQESGNEIKNWENKLKIPVYPQVPLPYDQVYDMDGEEFFKQEENQYHEYTSNCLMS